MSTDVESELKELEKFAVHAFNVAEVERIKAKVPIIGERVNFWKATLARLAEAQGHRRN